MNKERLLSIIKKAPYGDGHVFGDIMLPEVMDLLVQHISDSVDFAIDDRPLATMLNCDVRYRPTMTMDRTCALCENFVLHTDKFCASCGAEFYTE